MLKLRGDLIREGRWSLRQQGRRGGGAAIGNAATFESFKLSVAARIQPSEGLVNSGGERGVHQLFNRGLALPRVSWGEVVHDRCSCVGGHRSAKLGGGVRNL